MNTRTLLTMGWLIATPGVLLAQSSSDVVVPALPSEPTAPSAPRAPRAPRAVSAPPSPVMELPPSPASAPQAPAAPKAQTAPAPAAAPAPPAPPRRPGQLINVRVEVTLSDSKGVAKTLTMTVADSESGMNRTSSTRRLDGNSDPARVGGYVDFSFNADAAPEVSGSKIRLRLTADANIPVDATSALKLTLRQSQTLIMNDGETVEIARSADPVSDRNFVLTVKATIQR